jgi:hypothetical protein
VVPAFVITPTFDATITSDPNAATIEASINRVIQSFEDSFSDNITVNITFQEVTKGLGGSSTATNTVSYSSYLAALTSHATTADDATALASLPAGPNTPVGGAGNTNVILANALANALGLAGAVGTDSTISLNTSIMNLDRTSPQNPKNYDLMDTTAHEIDEALALGSAMDGQTNGDTANSTIKPLDLFRYSANGVRSYDTLLATTSYFSIDGGATNLIGFNQYSPNVPAGNTPDFGDWFSNNGAGNAVNAHVQDSNAQAGQYDTLSVELRRLDVLGYTRITTAAPVVTPPADQGALEGATTTFNLGNFTAASPNAPWGVTVSWGDGTSSPIFFLNSAGSLGTLSHTYAEEGSYPVTVNVTDFVSNSDTKTFNVNVSDQPVSPTGGFTVTAAEGQDSGPQTVATFTDPGGPEVLGDYSAVIDWGDGNTSAGTISFDGVSTYTVTGNHIYAEESGPEHPGSTPYTITVTINHDSAPPATAFSSATVSELSVSPTGGFSFAAVEGALSASQTVATFTDPGGPEAVGDYSATIAWGDGQSSAGTITFDGVSTFTVSGAHTYGEEGTDTITVTIHHETSTDVMTTSTATVSDPPVLATGVDVSAKECILFNSPAATFTDPGGAEPNPSDPIPDISSHYTATVDFGDGKGPVAATITYSGVPFDGSTTNTFTVTAMHTFDEEGTFTVTTDINHEGMHTVVNSTATVRDNYGLVLLDATSPKSLAVTGNGSVTVTHCGAIVADSSDPQAIFLSGNAVATATEADVGPGGGFVTHGSAVLNLLEPEFNQELATPDPVNLPLPTAPAVVSTALHISSGAVTLSPGTYVGGIAIDGTASVTLLGGVYYMQGGGFKVSGTGSVAGTGVLLVNAPAGPGDVISITGQGNVSLTAPEGLTGSLAAYNHIVIFQDPASANTVTVTGQASLAASGTLYAPAALLKINANGTAVVSTDTNPTGGQVIVFDAQVTTNGALTINADPPDFAVPAAALSATAPPSVATVFASPSAAARAAQPIAPVVATTDFVSAQAVLARNGRAVPATPMVAGTLTVRAPGVLTATTVSPPAAPAGVLSPASLQGAGNTGAGGTSAVGLVPTVQQPAVVPATPAGERSGWLPSQAYDTVFAGDWALAAIGGDGPAALGTADGAALTPSLLGALGVALGLPGLRGAGRAEEEERRRRSLVP